MSDAFLSLRGVGKTYRTASGAHEVLRDVHLDVRRGEFVCIVGYSGSGKSTLISLIAGLTTPDRGQLLLDGKPVTGPGPDRGVVFQNYSLLPWLTVFDNILLAVRQVFPDGTRAEMTERVEHYLALVNLAAAAKKRPAQLSGGMRQRVSLARALAMSPEVLLMDEPLSALDALTRGTLQEEIARIWRQEQKTVVMITNHVDEAILLADRIVPLSPGPGATLGHAIAVDLPRPRDARMANHSPEFQRLRAQVTEFLIQERRNPRGAAPTPAEAAVSPLRHAPIQLESRPRRKLQTAGV